VEVNYHTVILCVCDRACGYAICCLSDECKKFTYLSNKLLIEDGRFLGVMQCWVSSSPRFDVS
jgi:hypothetical protein